MHERRIRLEPDLVARTELMPLAEHGDHLLAAEFGEHLGLRSRRLNHDDLGLGAVIGDGEMLGPHAVDSGLAVGIGGRGCQRQLYALRPPETGAARRLEFSREENYPGGTPESGGET